MPPSRPQPSPSRATTVPLRATVATFLRGERDEQSGPELGRAVFAVLLVAVVLANLVGAAAVLAVIYLVLPLPPLQDAAHVRQVNAIVALVYIVLAVAAGALAGVRALRGIVEWLAAEREADDRIQRLVVTAPLILFRVQAGLWFVAAAIFAALNAGHSAALAAIVGLTVAVTGVTTGACAYLLAERILRKPASRALATAVPDRLAVPGVGTRAVLAWAFGSGVPVLGLVGVGVVALAGGPASAHQLSVAIVGLGGIALTVGLLAVALAARATADPIEGVRIALERVQRGEFDLRVPVYDGTQIGKLQLGFNRMAEGLAERERIRTALGTYVDPDVAERILEEGAELSGEEVEVTVMFLDVRGFTAFAEGTPAREVVAAVNALFERVIPILHAHGGRVDKFVGDGLLAVFGAPRALEHHADAGLAAALEIAPLSGSGGLEFGLGLNSGVVVAGNVGGGGRLEFSVMGDPVNVAARVEAATRDTGDTLLISEHTRALLSAEPVALVEREGVTLKGKAEKVCLFAPAVPDRTDLDMR